jgi:hypothetical protein
VILFPAAHTGVNPRLCLGATCLTSSRRRSRLNRVGAVADDARAWKSGEAIVAVKPANEAERSAAESAEPRAQMFALARLVDLQLEYRVRGFALARDIHSAFVISERGIIWKMEDGPRQLRRSTADPQRCATPTAPRSGPPPPPVTAIFIVIALPSENPGGPDTGEARAIRPLS